MHSAIALAWLAYPRLKTALNARHQAAMAAGEARRGPIRDSATLLDECGILIPYAETAHAEAIDQMRWSTLWLTHRADWGRVIDAYPVGHALPEMLLAPFIGLTGKASGIVVVVKTGSSGFSVGNPCQELAG